MSSLYHIALDAPSRSYRVTISVPYPYWSHLPDVVDLYEEFTSSRLNPLLAQLLTHSKYDTWYLSEVLDYIDFVVTLIDETPADTFFVDCLNFIARHCFRPEATLSTTPD